MCTLLLLPFHFWQSDVLICCLICHVVPDKMLTDKLCFSFFLRCDISYNYVSTDRKVNQECFCNRCIIENPDKVNLKGSFWFLVDSMWNNEYLELDIVPALRSHSERSNVRIGVGWSNFIVPQHNFLLFLSRS